MRLGAFGMLEVRRTGASRGVRHFIFQMDDYIRLVQGGWLEVGREKKALTAG